MTNLLFDLQLFTEGSEGQAETPSIADFGSMSVAQQSEILGNMVTGKAPVADPEPIEEEEEEAEEKEPVVVKRKIKVNGEEIELTEEELIAHAQKGMSADKKFEEAAKLRRELEAERKRLEEDKQKKQVEEFSDLDDAEMIEFEDAFKKTFKTDFNEFDKKHLRILAKYEAQKALQQQQQYSDKTIIDNAYKWAEQNPSEIEKLDEAIYELASEPSARKQFTSLLRARSNFDEGNATIKDLQLLEEFRLKAAATKPLPKEVVEEKKRVQKAERSGTDKPSKEPVGIDWERAKTDKDYQSQVLASITRTKK